MQPKKLSIVYSPNEEPLKAHQLDYDAAFRLNGKLGPISEMQFEQRLKRIYQITGKI